MQRPEAKTSVASFSSFFSPGARYGYANAREKEKKKHAALLTHAAY